MSDEEPMSEAERNCLDVSQEEVQRLLQKAKEALDD